MKKCLKGKNKKKKKYFYEKIFIWKSFGFPFLCVVDDWIFIYDLLRIYIWNLDHGRVLDFNSMMWPSPTFQAESAAIDLHLSGATQEEETFSRLSQDHRIKSTSKSTERTSSQSLENKMRKNCFGFHEVENGLRGRLRWESLLMKLRLYGERILSKEDFYHSIIVQFQRSARGETFKINKNVFLINCFA